MHGSGEAMPRARRHTIRGASPRPQYGVGRAIGRYTRHHRRQVRRAFRPSRPRYAPRYRPRRHLSAQQRNAKQIVKQAHRLHAPHNVQLSALATALVESHLQNLSSGDRDSLGLFQQRPSQGWGTPQQILNPGYAARKYLTAAKRQYRPGMNPGQLAQLVQRSAYPAKYSQALPSARRIERRIARL